MANLLAKFRIDYSSLTMVQDITEAPQPETRKMFDELIKKFTDQAGGMNIIECTLLESHYNQLLPIDNLHEWNNGTPSASRG